MRHLAAAFLFVLFAVPVAAAEVEAYTFMDGLYSFEAPKGWIVEGDEADLTGVSIQPEGDAVARMLITTPNPLVEGELEGVAGAYVKAVFDTIGAGGLDEVADGEFQGYPAVVGTFTIPVESRSFEGFVIAFDVDGYGVVFLALGSPDNEAFGAGIQHILDSYELDEKLLETHQAALREIGAKALEEVGRQMK